MRPAERAQAHDRNFVAAISMLAETLPSGSTARYGSIPIAITGVAGAFFNAAWVWLTPDPGWDVAVLQSSEMGRPIYERMGFMLVHEFAELVGGPTG